MIARWCNRMLFHFNDNLFALMNVHLQVQIHDEHPISTNDLIECIFVLMIIVLVLMTISFLVLNSKWCISSNVVLTSAAEDMSRSQFPRRK